MDKPLFYAAVFWIFTNSEWKILFQKRANTWYRDWYYQLPSWHIEEYEWMQASIVRECKEEINVEITKLKLSHITQWINPEWREYFNVYFLIDEYEWEIKNLEEDKCSELYWATEDEINTDILYEKDREILNYIKKWINFSETSPWEDEFNTK